MLAPANQGGSVSTLKFRPTLVPTLATVVLLVLLCTLGMWQLGRADYKDVYAFAILLVVLVFRPRGILGEQVSEKV